MNHLEPHSIQKQRERYIRLLAESRNATDEAKRLADNLYALDLTVYSKDYSFESMLYNSLAVSELDDMVSLHPEQIMLINELIENDASIISAPTSFGKTFCVFEYVARMLPMNVVMVVPTLALVEEYYKKVIKKYRKAFSDYRVYTNIHEDKEYDFSKHNLFILTHDKVVQDSLILKLKQIDFLVVDEIYKLETAPDNDRVLVLNMAYYKLAQKAKKYVLLAPFIKSVISCENLEKHPSFYRTDYSPVVNEVVTNKILTDKDRFAECDRLVEQDEKGKTLIYFPTVVGMYKYIKEVVSRKAPLTNVPDSIRKFIQWAREEIHEEWCLITALERGYLIHNGQIPIGTRIFQLDQYDSIEGYNRMLCTSTLLEGVNTTAERIIIVKPARKQSSPGESFSAFDFFNLVGRTGRLNEHFIGKAYYIQGPHDPEFSIEDAVRDIRFEITDRTDDMDIQLENIDENDKVKAFLDSLHIDLFEYKKSIGTKVRFSTFVELYKCFKERDRELYDELNKLHDNPQRGRSTLIQILYAICENKDNKLETALINQLIHKQRFSIKHVVNNVLKYYKSFDVDYLISSAIRLKNGFIENTFYNRVGIVMYFCQLERYPNTLIEIIKQRVQEPIEQIYFMNSKNKKTLVDLGIYERDVEKITKVIGDDFADAVELRERLLTHVDEMPALSYVSKYVIKNL